MNVWICTVAHKTSARLSGLHTPAFWADVREHRAYTALLIQGVDSLPAGVNPHIMAVWTSFQNYGGGGGKQRIVDRVFARLRDGDVLVFLDDDIAVIKPGWLGRFLDTLRQWPHIGIVGAQAGQIEPDGTTTMLDADETVVTAHYVSGGWMAVRADLFLLGAEWDLRYFPMYYDDVDLCLQARRLGFQVARVDLGGYLEHIHQQTPRKKRVCERNRKRFVAKWQWGKQGE